MSGSTRALFVATMQRALGLKRPFRFKIVPLLTAFVAYVPAMVFVGISVVLRGDFLDDLREGVVPDYPDFYGNITLAIVLFVAFVAPEVMVTDRRTGMLGLYLAAPLTRPTYLASKVASMFVLLLVVTVGPILFLMIGFVAIGIGPDGILDFLGTLLRILAAGTAVSLFFSAISLAISSMAKRNGFASAGIILLVFGSTVLANVVRESTDVGSWILLFDLLQVPFDVVTTIFGNVIRDGDDDAISATSAVLGYLVIVGASLALSWYRFLRTSVTR